MITIIDYKAGNLTSVKRALDYLGIESRISSDAREIEQAQRIIFPGVGHAKTAMAVLTQRGLDISLRNAITKGIPILGICLGTQIILSHSEEGDTPCLDIIPGKCIRFQLDDPTLKIPHMGWNAITVRKPHPVLKDLRPGEEVYFVHSFYPQPASADDIYATAEHGIEFASAIGCRNLFGTQFHPEKSGPAGLQMLKNFSVWDGTAC